MIYKSVRSLEENPFQFDWFITWGNVEIWNEYFFSLCIFFGGGCGVGGLLNEGFRFERCGYVGKMPCKIV